jgi:hypothetical protein
LYTTPVIYIFFDNLGARFSKRPSKTTIDQPETDGPHGETTA